jgi:ATP-dependent DNA ligase
VVDRELVATDSNGEPNFNALQNADADSSVVFYAFDVLTHRGEDMKALPLRDRLLCENFPGPAARFVAAVRKLGGEGVVGKRLDCR